MQGPVRDPKSVFPMVRPITLALLLLCAVCIAQSTAVSNPPGDFTEPYPDHIESRPDMTILQAVVLGVVEGITEYLPISSTGHLILTQRAMGIAESDVANAYAICIQGGAILAVVLLYYGRFKSMARGLFGYDRRGGRMALNLIVALAPLIVIVFLEKYIKEHLFGLWSVTLAWFVGGVAILAVSYSRRIKNRPPGAGRDLTMMTWRMALIIGMAQCIAVWPGVSRSLVTIVGGVLVGLSLPAAVEFSFILGVVTLLGATVKDAIEYGPAMLDAYGPTPIIAGFLSAFLAAFLAVQWLVAYLQRHGMEAFGYYRVALAIVVAALLLLGLL